MYFTPVYNTSDIIYIMYNIYNPAADLPRKGG